MSVPTSAILKVPPVKIPIIWGGISDTTKNAVKISGALRQAVIRGLQRVSKPGLRIYVNKNQIPVIFGNQGIAVLSTSRGILTSLEAKELGVGGEVICYVW